MTQPVRVLLVEDSEDDAQLTLRELARGGFEVRSRRVEAETELIAALREEQWDVILSDHSMPRFNSTKALELVRNRDLDVPFIIVSGTIGEDAAVASMRAGARDFLLKGDLGRLPAAIERELQAAAGRRATRVAEREIRHRANYDSLTDLPNRAHFGEVLTRELISGRQTGHGVGVLLLDVDGFKEVNDTFGHAAGDELLRAIAVRLRASMRKRDVVARLGGDEFGVVLVDLDAVAAGVHVAKKVSAVFDEPFPVEGVRLEIRASIGIASYPANGEDADTLLRRADIAMYSAKRGRTVYAVYREEDDHHSREQVQLMADLRHATERDELFLDYQPIVSMRTGAIESVEALVRWRHPVRGLVPPGSFIQLAERLGLMKPITEWVVRAALEQSRRWRAQGITIPVGVNLSAQDLADPQLASSLASAIEEFGASGSWLQVELTESVVMVDPARAARTFGALRELGVRVAIDDFGTGYSSLAYLHQLTIDQLKIDRSFVNATRENERSRAILKATIELGHKLGFTVIAEGIEDQSQWDDLAALGCDRAQGFYMCRPSPPERINALVEADVRYPASEAPTHSFRRATLRVVTRELTA